MLHFVRIYTLRLIIDLDAHLPGSSHVTLALLPHGVDLIQRIVQLFLRDLAPLESLVKIPSGVFRVLLGVLCLLQPELAVVVCQIFRFPSGLPQRLCVNILRPVQLQPFRCVLVAQLCKDAVNALQHPPSKSAVPADNTSDRLLIRQQLGLHILCHDFLPRPGLVQCDAGVSIIPDLLLHSRINVRHLADDQAGEFAVGFGAFQRMCQLMADDLHCWIGRFRVQVDLSVRPVVVAVFDLAVLCSLPVPYHIHPKQAAHIPHPLHGLFRYAPFGTGSLLLRHALRDLSRRIPHGHIVLRRLCGQPLRDSLPRRIGIARPCVLHGRIARPCVFRCVCRAIIHLLPQRDGLLCRYGGIHFAHLKRRQFFVALDLIVHGLRQLIGGAVFVHLQAHPDSLQQLRSFLLRHKALADLLQPLIVVAVFHALAVGHVPAAHRTAGYCAARKGKANVDRFICKCLNDSLLFCEPLFHACLDRHSPFILIVSNCHIRHKVDQIRSHFLRAFRRHIFENVSDAFVAPQLVQQGIQAELLRQDLRHARNGTQCHSLLVIQPAILRRQHGIRCGTAAHDCKRQILCKFCGCPGSSFGKTAGDHRGVRKVRQTHTGLVGKLSHRMPILAGFISDRALDVGCPVVRCVFHQLTVCAIIQRLPDVGERLLQVACHHRVYICRDRCTNVSIDLFPDITLDFLAVPRVQHQRLQFVEILCCRLCTPRMIEVVEHLPFLISHAESNLSCALFTGNVNTKGIPAIVILDHISHDLSGLLIAVDPFIRNVFPHPRHLAHSLPFRCGRSVRWLACVLALLCKVRVFLVLLIAVVEFPCLFLLRKGKLFLDILQSFTHSFRLRQKWLPLFDALRCLPRCREPNRSEVFQLRLFVLERRLQLVQPPDIRRHLVLPPDGLPPAFLQLPVFLIQRLALRLRLLIPGIQLFKLCLFSLYRIRSPFRFKVYLLRIFRQIVFLPVFVDRLSQRVRILRRPDHLL